MHRLQRELEAALKSDGRVKQLLRDFVSKFSDPNDKKQPGGLARALRNCTELKARFLAAVGRAEQEIQQALAQLNEEYEGPKSKSKGGSLSAATQRFDTILESLRVIVLNLRAVMDFLVHGVCLFREVFLRTWYFFDMLRVHPDKHIYIYRERNIYYIYIYIIYVYVPCSRQWATPS